jgi:chromosome segregation ATPase
MRIKIPSKIILALGFQGTASAFFLPVTKKPLLAPLQNSYLESLKGDKSVRIAAPQSATVGDAAFPTNGSTQSNVPLPQTPLEIKVDVPSKTEPTAFAANAGGTSQKTESKAAEMEVVPMDDLRFNAQSTQSRNGWSSTALGGNGEEVKTTQKSAYETQRQKYDQGAFLQNSQQSSLKEKRFQDEDKDKYDAPTSIVEVLPKDHPYRTGDSQKDYLTLKNEELAAANSQLQQENERQKYELDHFLRDSMSNPLYPRLPMNRPPWENGAPWEDDELLEANSRLQTENELQRQDLQSFHTEMKNMENVIQSIEDKSYMEANNLEEANNKLREESERQRQQLYAYKLQMTEMQNLVESIGDEALSLSNEKKKIQNDTDLLQSRLQGWETDSDRKLHELQYSKSQIKDLQNVIQVVKDQYAALQTEKDLVLNDKADLETRFDETIDEFQRQRYELDAYKTDRGSMESLVQTIKDESSVLKNDKKKLQETVLGMEQNLQKMSQQMTTSQENFNRMSAEKESIVIESGEAYRQLQGHFQDTVNEMKTLKEGKTVMETRLRSAESGNDQQRYEIENSNRDKRALEGMIQSMQEESQTLKNEKKTLETALMSMQQTLQNLEHQLSSSAEENERLRSEKDTVVSQSNEYYQNYQDLQLHYQDVLNDLETCRNDRASPQPRMELDGGEQDFMSRINNRRQNQMRRNQMDEPGEDGWWN